MISTIWGVREYMAWIDRDAPIDYHPTILDLCDVGLCELHEHIYNLRNLDTLLCTRNYLTSLPLRLPCNLVRLDVSYNRIRSIDTMRWPSTLQSIQVDNNELSVFTITPNMWIVWARYNRLHTIYIMGGSGDNDIKGCDIWCHGNRYKHIRIMGCNNPSPQTTTIWLPCDMHYILTHPYPPPKMDIVSEIMLRTNHIDFIDIYMGIL